jgi:hypothetical protein
LFPSGDPIGRSFVLFKEEYQVVGVAREINHPSLEARRNRPEFYQPIGAAARNRGYFMMSLRCDATCPDDATIRQRLRTVHPAISVIEVGPLEAEYFTQLAGPRAALGASQRQIRQMVFRDGAIVGGVGIAFGSLGGWWLAQGLTSLQYGVSRTDLTTWLVVAGVLALMTIASTWRPARQAARVDPATLLRSE